MADIKNTTDESTNVNPSYEIDPDGDVTLVVNNIARGLPADLKDVPPDLLAGNEELDESTPMEEESSEATEDADSTARHLRLRVSSKQLSLACPHFARMFKSDLREGTELRNNGRVELEVDQPCGTAVLLLMLVIHGRTRQVPRVVSKEMLIEIAVLVDYFECYKAVEVFFDMWITAIEPHPEERVVEMRDWVFISWVFSKKTIFEQTTLAVIRRYPTVIPAQGLPLPARILGLSLSHLSLHPY
ncbi:uncharacterized protein APUU_71139S [Aspergillus puulaauensis]|uniref:BTB domain-containing protein n=1 Tax=Aspergillus puulaauensis TaxID=1220207 RepID=A0A7R7XXX6_9EURO|nr:uncharacterized protein APUU_71139S [Aspergillus puulaauensis]BCS29569.1 hypothetical protein APUU_71139S [Aspergillus puulaauensis]